MVVPTQPDRHAGERGIAVITGASSGIGKAAALALADAGFGLMLAARREAPLAEVRAEILAARPGARIEIRATDVGDPEECEALIAATVERLGPPEVVVTAAAAGCVEFHALDLTAPVWDSTFSSTVRGSILVAVAAAREMKAAGRGRIILISSINGTIAEPQTAHFAAAKAAIDSAARGLAVDLAAHGIAVNALAPGWVDTPQVADFLAEVTEERLAQLNPLGRVGRPEEIAAVIKFLATDAPAYLTGSTLYVDGGQTAVAVMP